MHGGGRSFLVNRSETLLEAALRSGFYIPAQCRVGACQTCMVRCLEGLVPAASRAGLTEAEIQHGYFLACLCQPEGEISVARAWDF